MTFGLPEAGRVKLAIYDLSGRLVEVVDEGEKAAGVHSVQWNAKGLPSGLYIARLDCGGNTAMRKLTLVK